MMYIRNPNPDRTWEAYLEDALSTEALQYVEQYVKDNPTQSAGTEKHGDDQDIRKSDITWININEDAQMEKYINWSKELTKASTTFKSVA